MYINVEVMQARMDDLRREADYERLIAGVRRTRAEGTSGANVVRSQSRRRHQIVRRVATALRLAA